MWACRFRPIAALLLTLVVLLMTACSVLGAMVVSHNQQWHNEHGTKEHEALPANSATAFIRQEACGRVCLTEHCVAAAAAMLRFMDRQVNPCNDFYQFACGRWSRHHPLPDDKAAYDTFSRLREDLQTHLKDILEAPVSTVDSNATRNAKNLYKSCTNITLVDSQGGFPLQQLLESLGRWPIVNSKWEENKTNLAELLAEIKLFNNDVIAAIWVNADTKNSSFNIIQIDQPDLGMPSRDYFLRKEHFHEKKAYFTMIAQVARLLTSEQTNIDEDAESIVEFETQLANITRPSELRRNFTELYKQMTVFELQALMPALDWQKYFNLTSPYDIDLSEPIAVYAYDYLHHLNELLTVTPIRTVTNYVLWRFVQNRIGNLDQRFLQVRQSYIQVLYGRQRQPERWRECVTYVNANMGMAVGALFVRDMFGDNSKAIAESMIASIREAFIELLEDVEWMDTVTRRVARAKARAIREKIGYPEYILDAKKLDRDYEDLEFRPDTYFENVLMNLRHLARIDQERLRVPVNKTLWSTTPAVVNAFYSRTKNQILFPAGILQPPFYHEHYPKSLNYGGIGVVIGHELTHGFDDKGRQFDLDGNLKQWWHAESIERFHRKAQCIIDQYGRYKLPELGLHLNGITTQGENIADNGGIKQAFRAYSKWVLQHGEEPLLPGINLTHNQLFYVNYAQVWCGIMRPEAALTKLRSGPHSPGRFRVIGTLSNSYDFAKAFDCPVGSPMNPKHKCSVW